jgi:hypothetical protein
MANIVVSYLQDDRLTATVRGARSDDGPALRARARTWPRAHGADRVRVGGLRRVPLLRGAVPSPAQSRPNRIGHRVRPRRQRGRSGEGERHPDLGDGSRPSRKPAVSRRSSDRAPAWSTTAGAAADHEDRPRSVGEGSLRPASALEPVFLGRSRLTIGPDVGAGTPFWRTRSCCGRRFAGYLLTHQALSRIAKTTDARVALRWGRRGAMRRGPMGPSASGLSPRGPSLNRVQAVYGGAGRSEVQ